MADGTNIYTIIVCVALSRPPTCQEVRKYRIAAHSAGDAKLCASQIASCTSVMPVCAYEPHEWQQRHA